MHIIHKKTEVKTGKFNEIEEDYLDIDANMIKIVEKAEEQVKSEENILSEADIDESFKGTQYLDPNTIGKKTEEVQKILNQANLELEDTDSDSDFELGDMVVPNMLMT